MKRLAIVALVAGVNAAASERVTDENCHAHIQALYDELVDERLDKSRAEFRDHLAFWLLVYDSPAVGADLSRECRRALADMVDKVAAMERDYR